MGLSMNILTAFKYKAHDIIIREAHIKKNGLVLLRYQVEIEGQIVRQEFVTSNISVIQDTIDMALQSQAV
jgi:hypothetical protein